MEIPSFNQLIQQSIIKNWDLDALTDYKGATRQYHDVARKIEKLHIMFENSGVVKGDKIALCGRNSANWATAFLATLTYGAVAVPILHEFTADQIHNIVEHSEAKLLFVGGVVATTIDPSKMPGLEGIIYIPDYSLVISRTDKLTYAREHLNEMYGHKFPKYFRKEHVSYYFEQSPDELALINYTSGTTGFSKGVMIPYRSLVSNLIFAHEHIELKTGDGHVCMLPMAHAFGLLFSFLFEFGGGGFVREGGERGGAEREGREGVFVHLCVGLLFCWLKRVSRRAFERRGRSRRTCDGRRAGRTRRRRGGRRAPRRCGRASPGGRRSRCGRRLGRPLRGRRRTSRRA